MMILGPSVRPPGWVSPINGYLTILVDNGIRLERRQCPIDGQGPGTRYLKIGIGVIRRQIELNRNRPVTLGRAAASRIARRKVQPSVAAT